MVAGMPERHESKISALVQESFALQEQDAIEADSLAFLARLMVQATMPHSKPTGHEFTRRNGNLTLTMLSPSVVGLPYGSMPRLLISWLTTEAVRTRERRLVLGSTLSDFLRRLDLARQGGPRGDITRLQTQMRRLFAASISAGYEEPGQWSRIALQVASKVDLWWDPRSPEQAGLWHSTVTLGEEFFTEITSHPVPVDLRALRLLSRSPLALDVYSWLTWRMFTLRKPTTVPWEALRAQFGADYGRLDNFRAALRTTLAKVHVAYPQARVEITEAGLHLRPSPPHVPRLRLA